MLVIFIISVVVCLSIIFLRRFNEFRKFSKLGIPGPKPSLIFGNTKSAFLRTTNIVYDVDKIYQEFKGKTLVVGFFVMGASYFLALDPDLIKSCRKFRNNDFVLDPKKDPLMSQNPFFVKDDAWKIRRRETDAALSAFKVRAMFPRMIDSSHRLISYVKQELRKNELVKFEARDLTTRYTCDVAYSCLYGLDSKSFSSQSEMKIYGEKYLKGVMNALASFFPKKMLTDDVVEYFKDLTRDAIKYRLENNIVIDDMLQQTIEMQQSKSYDEDYILAHCLTLFLDTFETAGITLQNTIYELANHPKAQQKLRREILDAGEDLSYEKLSELPYLNQVFHETLRLHPAIPSTTRICSSDIEVEGAFGEKLLIPKDSAIWINIHSIQRDPEYYSDPTHFNPERFDEEFGGVKAFKDRCILIPFGDGPRICSGMKLAHAEIKIAIAELIRNFEILPGEGFEGKFVISPYEFMNLPDKKISFKFVDLRK